MNNGSHDSQAPASKQPELREVTKDQLAEILEQHRKWVESERKEGERADLSQTNLKSHHLSEANLQEADLSHSNLQGTDLSGANFQKANMIGAKLDGATLLDVNLKKADLRKATLQKANLRGANLQEADLAKALLQEAKLHGANFSNVGNDPQGAHLFQANLERAVLVDANLQRANLIEANLIEANLQEANLQNAKLLRTKLREANFQDADLTDATGLLSGQLAGTNVSGAKLPEGFKEFKGLEIVAEASKNARKIFVSVLLGCVYSWLTIATTTDVRLLTNSASSPLPIIQTPIPIAWFYIAAPLVLICLYFYLHLYLQRLWEGLAELPAVFPDGRPLDKRAFPWLLNGLVRAHFKLLGKDRPALSRLQTAISILLAWWVLPATLLVFWGRYLTRHDWWGTRLHIALLVAAIMSAIMFHRLARATLRGQEWKALRWKNAWTDARACTRGTLALGIVALFSVLSFGAIEGMSPQSDLAIESGATHVRVWVPKALAFVGYNPFADLDEVEVSTKPPSWTGTEQNAEDEIVLVKGARLKGSDLRYANAHRAFFVNADLREAKLEGADLRETDFRRAILEDANLRAADLRDAVLREANFQRAELQQAKLEKARLDKAKLEKAKLNCADLSEASLQEAELQGADLRDADLSDADLRKAKLGGADLRRANLEGANLKGAELKGANLLGANLGAAKGLTKGQVRSARNWVFAVCPRDRRGCPAGSGLPWDHGWRLRRKDLSGYELERVDLKGSDLRGFNLQDAKLRGANLGEALLQEAKLQRADLRQAKLSGADLRHADLEDADLYEAELREADLRGANLEGANLQRAFLWNAEGLTVEQLKTARNWPLAFYRDDFLEKLGIRGPRPDHDNNLQSRDLRGYNLQGVNLHGANLEGFRLSGATLQGADVQGADLRNAKGLTVDQVRAARNWRLAFYSDDVLKQLGLPPDHNERVRKKLDELEKKKKKQQAGGS